MTPHDADDPARPREPPDTVAALRLEADRTENAAVEDAMRSGWSWSQVAEALGVTRQAVHKKHWRRLDAAGIDLKRRQG